MQPTFFYKKLGYWCCCGISHFAHSSTGIWRSSRTLCRSELQSILQGKHVVMWARIIIDCLNYVMSNPTPPSSCYGILHMLRYIYKYKVDDHTRTHSIHPSLIASTHTKKKQESSISMRFVSRLGLRDTTSLGSVSPSPFIDTIPILVYMFSCHILWWLFFYMG